MRNTQIACPYCNSTLTFGDAIAPGAAVPCLVCGRAFVPCGAAPVAADAGSAMPQAAAPAANSRALLAGGLIFAGLAVLVIGAMSLGLWLAFGRPAAAAEVNGELAAVVLNAGSPTRV